ncbi:phthiocerol/phthiodiolone dimycocerosyl transferase family protein [Leptospira wolffii]|uniref:phthiocerol/phthiodiolone dimycocerosyl transferase family protein n=1 Tax=Leptospira wolffii TaxID=409998 RepID=UPI0002D3BA9F|nr:condensation domain-containing protein [Leptospira wolffii]EPG64579.1 condensation domain protein [Leptospira wolffii serovar Khorat str. Khorat-H2]
MQNITESENNKITIERRLDRAETGFWLYDRVSSMNFCVMAELEGSVSREKLQSAIDRVQASYPNARVSIRKKEEEDSVHLAFISDPDSRIVLQNQIENPDWQDFLARETIRLFYLNETPLVRAYLCGIGSNRSVFALVFNHSIADGRSGCNFLLEILKSYDSSYSGSIDKHYNSMMNLYEGKTPEKKASEAKRKPDPLPNFSRKKEETNPRMESMDLNSSLLGNLLQRAKEKCVSLHGLVGSAQIKSLSRLFQDGAGTSLNLATPVDLRPYLKENVPSDALGLYISLFTTEIDPRTSFWEIASAINRDLKRKLESGQGTSFYEILPSLDQFLKREEAMRVFASLMQRNPQASVLSNVGILPDLENPKDFRIGRISFTVHPSITQVLFTTLTTFRGEARIQFNYDSNRWRKEDFQIFREEFERLLTYPED